MVATRELEILHERVVADRARHGDGDAFRELYRRHAPSAWRLAQAVTRQPAAAADAVAQAFARVTLRAEGAVLDVDTSFRASLLAATRNAALGQDPSGPSDHRSPTELTVASHDNDPSALAFSELPERWRSVLWLTEIEGLPEPVVGRVLGLSAEGTALLADRARDGLRERVSRAQLRAVTQPECEWAAWRLDAYATDGLNERDTTRVRRHLDDCHHCRTRLVDLEDLTPRLHRSVAVLPPLLLAASETEWRRALPHPVGRLGLRLPGGYEVPVWAERVLAGATAAVVALGITGAVLTSGRGKDPAQVASARSGQPFDVGDGESAAGTPRVGRTDDGGPLDGPAETTAATPSQADPAASRPARSGPTDPSAAVPRGPVPTTPPLVGPPAPPAGPTGPTAPPSVPPSDPGADPGDVAVRIDDTTGISVGECTGAEILGVVLGCEPGGDTALLGATPLPLP